MKKYLLALPVLIAVAVFVSGCTVPYDGSPPKVEQSRIDAVAASATAYLASTEGQDMFPAGLLATPIPVFDENKTFDHWILPVKNDAGLYVGFFIEQRDNFSLPANGVTKYNNPRINLFSKTKDEAYTQMLTDHVYSADQVKEPFVSIIPNMGYYWLSDVVINGKYVTNLTVAISITFPSKADGGNP